VTVYRDVTRSRSLRVPSGLQLYQQEMVLPVANVVIYTVTIIYCTEVVVSRYSHGLRARRRGSIPGKGKRFFSSPQCPDRLWDPPIQWVPGALSPGVKRLGHEADHSPTSSAEVKNFGAIPSIPHMSSWHCT
jgi:hypothetical protein